MRVALDTNIYSLLGRGSVNDETAQLIQSADSLGLPVIVLAELYAGFRQGKLKDKNIQNLKKFLLLKNVEVLNTTLDTSEIYGDMHFQLAQMGKPIPTNDLWIAALVAENGYTLCTADQHFKLIEGLPVIWH